MPFVPHLDGVGQGDGDGERQPLGDGHHQHRHADDEELDEVLDVDGGALGHPGTALDPEGVDHEEEDEDDDGHRRHDQTWRETSTPLPICTASLVSLPCSTDFSFLVTLTFLTGLASSFSSFSSDSAASSLFSGWISRAMPSWVLAGRGGGGRGGGGGRRRGFDKVVGVGGEKRRRKAGPVVEGGLTVKRNEDEEV
ncbi:hypothetical protein EYF80_001138 [Liparis tanakae]|uniref:Uncharacterized protein n=1 Tax=Liparis tanakae TaxID=230148 RepID=A0A4Z2JEY0_9TELE|nr:hypothetical protein EYF80_001138 [Liparis tanakae]